MAFSLKHLSLALCLVAAPVAQAQTDQAKDTSAASTDSLSTDTSNVAADDLLTQAEIEKLVGPVALYPDTLLMQILVASTYPLEIIKADHLLADNAGADKDALQARIKSEDYDPSVEVLATAFPEVVSDMATHVGWTEAMGDAMLAQSDDVMKGIQTLRKEAVNNGALTSGDEQTVEVNNDNQVIIQPTDPEVVYVPQYNPQVVYQNSNVVGDALMAGAIAFGTYAVIDAIFNKDDPWNNYWGCHNCGGWGGNPIIRSPNIDLDVDGNVNIGNKVNIGDRGNLGDKTWRPDDKRREDARKKIAAERGPDGKTRLPIGKGNSRGDAMRENLAKKTGAADISRPGVRPPKIDRPSVRPEGSKKDAIARTRPATHKPAANRPAVRKPAAKKPVAKKAAPRHKPSAMAKTGPSHHARAASHRGKSGGNRKKRR